jgi:U3 small nucleolar ribonucleoprotein protein IMP4
MGMQELLDFSGGEPLIIIGEYHGNPGGLNFYDETGKLLFSIRFSDSYSKEIDSYWFQDLKPFLAGEGEITDAFETFFHFQKVEKGKTDQLPAGSTLIEVRDKDIDFMRGGKSLFRLNIKGFKKY